MKTARHILIAPAALSLMMLVAAYAVFFVVSFATQEPGGINSGPPFGLHNYLRYLASSSALGVLGLTVGYSIAVSLVVVVIGFPLAYFLVRTESSALRACLLGLLIVTFFSGSVTRAYGWLVLLGNRGLINALLIGMGVTDRPIRMVYNMTGVSVALIHFLLPYFVFSILGTMKNLSRSCEEAARDLGAGPMLVFRRVTLPLCVPGLMVAGTLIYSVALSTFIFPLLLGGGRVELVSNAIYREISVNFDQPYAAASSAIFLVVSLGSVFLCLWLQRRLTRRPGMGEAGA